MRKMIKFTRLILVADQGELDPIFEEIQLKHPIKAEVDEDE